MFWSEKRFFPAVAAIAAAAGLARAAAAADKNAPETGYDPPPFSTYQPILDRMPFGPLPANFNPNAAEDAAAVRTEAEVKMEQAKLAKQVKLSCVNISPDGETMVGFSVLDGKTQSPFYLEVGDSRDGWTVVDADYDREWAKIEKDNVEITLKLGKGLVDSQSVAATKPAAEKPRRRQAAAAAAESADLPPRATKLLSRLLSNRPARHGSPFRALRARNAAAETSAAGAPPPSSKRSFTERLKERARIKSAEQAAREKENRENILKLARETMQAELARQKEEEAAAAEEQRFRMEQGE